MHVGYFKISFYCPIVAIEGVPKPRGRETVALKSYSSNCPLLNTADIKYFQRGTMVTSIYLPLTYDYLTLSTTCSLSPFFSPLLYLKKPAVHCATYTWRKVNLSIKLSDRFLLIYQKIRPEGIKAHPSCALFLQGNGQLQHNQGSIFLSTGF